MNAKTSTATPGPAPCTNRGSCLREMGRVFAAAALAAGLILLGLGENARAADNVLGARADDAAKSAISAPPPPPPPVPLGVFCDNNVPQGKFVFSITPIFAGLSGLLIGTRGVSNEFVVSTVPFFLNPSQKVRLLPEHINVAIQGVRLRYG
ncbi:MAG: hypothetical protein ACREDU_02005, partial [Methylocella sp.]